MSEHEYGTFVVMVLGPRLRRVRSVSDREDLIGAGLLGLARAVQRFDPSRGCKFSTYAGKLVLGAALDYLRLIDTLPRGSAGMVRPRMVRLTEINGFPAHGLDPSRRVLARELLAGLSARPRFVIQQFMRDRSDAETASMLGVGVSRICQIRSKAMSDMREAA